MPSPSSEIASTKHTLRAQNLSCARGERELFKQLSFSLLAGQCLHVIGSNGCGKTSLLRIVAGLNEASSGQVFWDDAPIVNNLNYAQHRDYIGHHDGLKNELSAFENLSFYQKLNGISNNQLVDRDLAKMELLHSADLTANRLSFGQRRRLALARLLSAERALWILDEPFTGIDDSGRRLIEQLCVEHLQNGGSILLTNHRSLASSALSPYLYELSLSEYAATNAPML